MDSVLALLISAILGGGLFKGIEALYRAVTDSREKKTLSEIVGAKTPAEIDSVSVATMTTALESAQRRIIALEKEREQDHVYYQQRIAELTSQLKRVREEMVDMERKLAELLAETHHVTPPPEGVK